MKFGGMTNLDPPGDRHHRARHQQPPGSLLIYSENNRTPPLRSLRVELPHALEPIPSVIQVLLAILGRIVLWNDRMVLLPKPLLSEVPKHGRHFPDLFG